MVIDTNTEPVEGLSPTWLSTFLSTFNIGTHPEHVEGVLSDEQFKEFFYPNVIY